MDSDWWLVKFLIIYKEGYILSNYVVFEFSVNV